jgi:hypothetical protein
MEAMCPPQVAGRNPSQRGQAAGEQPIKSRRMSAQLMRSFIRVRFGRAPAPGARDLPAWPAMRRDKADESGR